MCLREQRAPRHQKGMLQLPAIAATAVIGAALAHACRYTTPVLLRGAITEDLSFHRQADNKLSLHYCILRTTILRTSSRSWTVQVWHTLTSMLSTTRALNLAPKAISCSPTCSSFAPCCLLSRHLFSARPAQCYISWPYSFYTWCRSYSICRRSKHHFHEDFEDARDRANGRFYLG